MTAPQVPELNKSVIREKLAELRVMQKTTQHLTSNSASEILGNKYDISQVITDTHGIGADALNLGTT